VQRRFRAGPIVAAFLATVLAALLSRHAWAGDIEVVVRTVTAEDRLIFERIIGHASDLPVRLRELRERALEGDLVERLEKASALAKTGARVVVWFEHPPPSELRVVVALPREDRVLVRAVGGAQPLREGRARATSAALEEAALLVSTSLYAIEADGVVGVSREELLGLEGSKAGPPPPPPPPPPPEGSETARAEEGSLRLASTKPEPGGATTARSTSPWHALIGVGWQLSLDGESPAGARAGAITGLFEWREYLFQLGLSLGLPSRIYDSFSLLELSRHDVRATFGKVLIRAQRWRVHAGFGAGGVSFVRASTPRDPRLVPSAKRMFLSPFAAVDIAVRYLATPNLGLMAVAGVDGIASPPTFAYEVRGAPLPSRTLWSFEPRASFFVFYAFP
jgi:hypothetical protein